jgi:5-methylcytosine-specific restriction endonuclease McrA
MSDTPLDTVAFAERLLAMLEEGKRSSTYKLAVLLALIELCFEKTKANGDPPDMVMSGELAEKVVEIYWGQAGAYPPLGRVLEQNQGTAVLRGTSVSAKIVRDIAEFRVKHASLTIHESRTQNHEKFERLVRQVEKTLIKMPLPKLQRMGRAEQPFLYRIAWNDNVPGGTWSGTRGFDSRIWFVDGAARNLVRLSSLLRPLIQQKWSAMVADLNRLEIGKLESFLFGADRKALKRVADPLLDLQCGKCFYCEKTVPGRGHVDHFIPWSRHADDGLDNLVVADERCNLAKRNFLAGRMHLDHWLERGQRQSAELNEIATRLPWQRDKQRTTATVRAFYRSVPGGFLWVGGSEFEAAP